MTKDEQRKREREIAKENSTCPSGKIQYRSAKLANMALLQMWRDGNMHCERSYPCPDCGYHHLTSLKEYNEIKARQRERRRRNVSSDSVHGLEEKANEE